MTNDEWKNSDINLNSFSRAIVVDMNESNEIKDMLKKTAEYNENNGRKAVNMSALASIP